MILLERTTVGDTLISGLSPQTEGFNKIDKRKAGAEGKGDTGKPVLFSPALLAPGQNLSLLFLPLWWDTGSEKHNDSTGRLNVPPAAKFLGL